MVLVYFQGNILNEGYIHSDLLRLTFFAHNLFIFISRFFSIILFTIFSIVFLTFGSVVFLILYYYLASFR